MGERLWCAVALDHGVHRWRSVLQARRTRCIDASGRCPNPHTHATYLDEFPNAESASFCFLPPAPLRWRVMNENAAVKAPHLLFGPITSLESLQRFKWHPYSRICPGTDRRKMLSLGDADTKICSSPTDGFRSKRRSRDVRGALYAHTRTNPHSSVSLPRPGTTRGPDEKHRICCGP